MVFNDNKREYHRIQTNCPVLFRTSADGELQEGLCLNLSTGGIAFQTDQDLAEGSRIDIFITPEAAIVPPLNASVEILRVSDSGNSYEVAGRITEMR